MRHALPAIHAIQRCAIAAGLVALGACYRGQHVDARTVLAELDAEQRAPAAPDGPDDGHVPAGATPEVAHAVTEDEAVALALRFSPDLRAARRQRGIAEGQIVAAGALANPTVEIQLLHLQDWGTRNGWSVELAWEPPQPWLYGAKRAAARAAAAAVGADVAEAEWQLAASVRAAHAALLALQEQRALVEQGAERRRRVAELVERRVSAGAGTRIDSGLALLAVSQLERERDDLAAQEIAAARDLGQLLGAAHPVRAAGAIPEPAGAPPALDALVEAAIASRPALAAEVMRFRQREEELRAEHARNVPWLRLSAAPRYRADSSERYTSDVLAGVQLTLPLFNFNAGPIAVAEGVRDQQHEQLRKLVAGVRRLVAAARDEIALRQATLRRYRESILPGLDAHEQLLTTAVAGGQLDLVARLTAEDVLLRGRRELVSFRLAHYRAWIDLDRSVGRHVATERRP